MDYRVPAEKKPTYWTEETAIGALAGTLMFPIVGTLIGGAIGAAIGKSRMEEDERTGRVVKEPTFWNKKAAIGLLAGVLFAPIIAGVFIAAGSVLLTGGTILAGLGLNMVFAAIGGIAGLSRGGRAGIEEMENDWQAAKKKGEMMGEQCMQPKEQERPACPAIDKPAPEQGCHPCEQRKDAQEALGMQTQKLLAARQQQQLAAQSAAATP